MQIDKNVFVREKVRSGLNENFFSDKVIKTLLEKDKMLGEHWIVR